MLFTTPLTLNDGVADRIFNWLRQVPGEIAGLYKETAATAISESQLKTAHSVQKNLKKRHMLQKTEVVDLVNPGDSDPSNDAIVVTITVVHNSKHSDAEIEKQVKLLTAAASTVGFSAAFVSGEI